MLTQGVSISGVGSYVPDQKVSNCMLALPLGLPGEWIEQKTAIQERRWADSHEATSDFASMAAKLALAHANLSAQDIDLLIVGTSTPDYPQPSTACLVQRDLGATNAFCFDLNAVCSSFLYALETARSLLKSNSNIRHALVIGAETYSRILDREDKRTSILFGDGAGAVVLSRDHDQSVSQAKLTSDGSKWDYVIVPGGGSRRPLTNEVIEQRDQYFKMKGRAVREYVHEMFPKLLQAAAQLAGIDASEFEHIICHQANGHMLDECRTLLGIPEEKMHLTLTHYGNTGAASIPITLDDAFRKGKLRPGDRIALLTFGGGMTCGATSITWKLDSSYGYSPITLPSVNSLEGIR